MTANEILQTVRPKMPYWWRVHLRHGRTVDVRYPALMLVTTRTIVVSERDPEDDDDDWPIAGKSWFIPPEEIVRLEPLGPNPPARNGA